MSLTDSAIYVIAGGVGGTAGTILTSPLEVIKTRLQSSNATFGEPASKPAMSAGAKLFPVKHIVHVEESIFPALKESSNNLSRCMKKPINVLKAAPPQLKACQRNFSTQPAVCSTVSFAQPTAPNTRVSLVNAFRYIYKTEGLSGFFKGLLPSIVGIAPSRAIYFGTYSSVKSSPWVQNYFGRETAAVHLISAGVGGFVNTTTTNPLWVIKTRLQLDQQSGSAKMTLAQCMKRMHAEAGIRAFWKGVTASYVGISETMLHFLMYERFKAASTRWLEEHDLRQATYFAVMASGATSKLIAGTAAYPHEVARTRLREEKSKYRGFLHCLQLIRREEGYAGWYRGLYVHLLRQVPNTAITLVFYELTVCVLKKLCSRDWQS